MGAPSAPQALEHALATLAEGQHGVVAARQLLRLGFSHKQIELRVASGRLRRLHRGVYLLGGAPLTREARWMAAVLAGGEGALLSHRDAAALWKLADYAHGPVEVTIPHGGSRTQPGIRIHRTRSLHPNDRSSHRGIPATSPERTLIDLAATIAPRHLELAFEEGLRGGILTVQALRDQVGRTRRRRGAPIVREPLGLDAPEVARTRSRLEVRFLRFCRAEGPPMPEVNAVVGGYEVDMSWPGTRVIVVTDRRLTRERSKPAATLRELLRLIRSRRARRWPAGRAR